MAINKVLITRYSVGSSQGDAPDSFDLAYAQIQILYRPQTRAGGAQGQIKASWDRQKNKPQ